MFTFRSHVSTIPLLLTMLGSGTANAQSSTFTYQGQLLSAGMPVNGSVDFSCSLWNAPTDGAQIFVTLDLPGIPVTEGLFTLPLDFGDGSFTGGPRWLEISVNGTPLSPRQELTATPYALHAARPWRTNGDDIYYLDGNVGIGTVVPTARLEIAGTPGVDGIMFPDGTMQTTAAGATNSPWQWNGTDVWYAGGGVGVTGQSSPFPSGKGVFLEGGGPNYAHVWAFNYDAFQPLSLVLNAPGGNVGIGTLTPAAKLHAAGSTGISVYGTTGGGRGVAGWATSEFGGIGVSGDHAPSGNYGFLGTLGAGVTGVAGSGVAGVFEHGPSGNFAWLGTENEAVFAKALYEDVGVRGRGGRYGVLGDEGSWAGVSGSNPDGTYRGNLAGVWAVEGVDERVGGTGVWGYAPHGAAAYGIWGLSDTGFAGYFSGKVRVTGFLEKLGGGFVIDHPTDPENRYLYHSFVESDEMKNLYDGIATLDDRGEVAVTLPDWFCAVNKDFRYQLTCLGRPAQVYIKQEIDANNTFVICGDVPDLRVSWQVTGIRDDAWARLNRLQVEVEKPDVERGTYLSPEAFGQPVTRRADYAKYEPFETRQQEIRADALTTESGGQARR